MSFLEILLSDHAKQRIKERRITRSQIRICLLQGFITHLDINGRKTKNLKFGNKTLEVIFLEQAHRAIIITAYWKGI